MEWLSAPAQMLNQEAECQALARQGQLTKPPGSLGRLEELATTLAGLQGKDIPQIDNIMIRVFAGDHGVVEEGVSAFPQAVTAEMVKNFSSGGAAISVLAETLEADFGVINLGTVLALPTLPNVQDSRVANGTRNFCKQAAMQEQELEQALLHGQLLGEAAAKKGMDLFIGGEMGIGNTTSASALACAILNQPASLLVGRGTGVDDAGIQRKQNAVERGLKLHNFTTEVSGQSSVLEILRCLGGLEISGLVGAYISCAQQGVAVLVDGFISSVAALVAVKLNPSIRPWLFFSHRSAEAGHGIVLEAMNADALLQLDLRLGEASGAALAAPLLKTACQLHASMATFEQAGVSS